MSVGEEEVAMNTEEIRNTKVENTKEDHFRRLPEELIVFIFNKVFDLKSLCVCSLVSKYFASLIPHVRTVTFALPSSEADSTETYERIFKFFRQVLHLESKQFPESLDMLSLQNMKLPVFLEKFRKLDSIYLDPNFPKNLDNSSLIMWKVKCRKMGLVENFVALLPSSVHKTEFDGEQTNEENHLTISKSHMKECFWLSFGRYTKLISLICMLIKSHSSLQSLAVIDSEQQCKLLIENEQLSRIRAQFHAGEVDRTDIVGTSLKMAWVPLLHLPLSGYVMRGVCLLVFKCPIESCSSAEQDGEYDDIMDWELGEQGNLLSEAMKEIMKNHRDKIHDGSQ